MLSGVGQGFQENPPFVLSGGAETVLFGGTIFNGTVGPDGYMGLGFSPGNGFPVPSAGGTASGTNVSGGFVNVETGGVAVSTTISGGGGSFGNMTVSVGGSASETTVGSSGDRVPSLIRSHYM